MARHINLLDPPSQTPSPFAALWQVLVPMALVVLVMVSWGAVLRWQTSGVSAQLDKVEAQRQPMETQLNEMQTGSAQDPANQALRQQLARAEAQLAARQDIAQALQRGELGTTKGFSELMRAFGRRTVADLWLTELSADEVTAALQIRGRTLEPAAVPRWLKQLSEEPALRGRRLDLLSLSPESEAGSAPLSVEPRRVHRFEIARTQVIAPAEASPNAPFASSSGVRP